MKNYLVLAFGILLSQSALAYQDGTYECKTMEGTPANVYKVETVVLNSQIRAPYLTLTRYFKDKEGKLEIVENQGFATVARRSNEGKTDEFLTLGSLSLEFSENKLANCKTP